MKRDSPDPLPSDWLPKPIAPRSGDDPEVWDVRIQKLMAAAEPRLARYRAGELGWWAALGRYWRPAAAAAFAAAAGLFVALGLGSATRGAVPESDLVLAAAASDGDPAVFWAALDAEADPVLALIVLEGGPQ